MWQVARVINRGARELTRTPWLFKNNLVYEFQLSNSRHLSQGVSGGDVIIIVFPRTVVDDHCLLWVSIHLLFH